MTGVHKLESPPRMPAEPDSGSTLEKVPPMATEDDNISQTETIQRTLHRKRSGDDTEDVTASHAPQETDFYSVPDSDYKVVDRIGEGAAALVYHVTYKEHDAALKLLRSAFRERSKFYQDFVQEVKVAADLKHPNIIAVLGANLVREQPLVLYEFLHGGTVEDFVDKLNVKPNLPRLKRKRLFSWLTGMMEALEYLHTRTPKIIHRDIKPSNLLLTQDLNTVKLGDFGLCRVCDGVSSPHVEKKEKGPSKIKHSMTGMTGTFRYMAPEVFRLEKDYTEKVDIFSAAVTMWTMCTYEVPFMDLDDKMIISGAIQLQDIRPPLSLVRAELRNVLTHAWASKAENRPTATEILRMLRKAEKQTFTGFMAACMPFAASPSKFAAPVRSTGARC